MATISQLFGELERHVKREEHDKALVVINKILTLDPKDKDALHCKAITLIRLEAYSEALTILTRQLDNQYIFEKAYCLYRTNQLQEGLTQIDLVRKDLNVARREKLPWDLRHLEAQMLYRLERYRECMELYQGMLNDVDEGDDGYNDILTNLNACKAALLYSGECLDGKWAIQDVTQTTYELSFNSACSRIAQGEYTKALKLLEEAERLCRESLSDYEPAEIDQELTVILVQKAYVFQLMGRLDQAHDLYQTVLKTKPLEVTAPAVAANNLVVMQGESDLYDSAKKIRTATAKQLGVKFFESQKRAIAMNEVLLQLYQGKFAACREAARQLLKTYSSNKNKNNNNHMDALRLILAATQARQKKTAKAIEELVEFAQERPESVALQFAILQLQLSQGNDYVAAIESLRRFLDRLPSEEQHRPGMVALLVWLYDQAGQGDKGVELLSESSAIWAKSSSTSAGGSDNKMPVALQRQMAAFKLRSHRYREAAKDYEALVRADPEDPSAIAGLIMAYSEYEPALAEQYGASLPEMQHLVHLDVEALEKVVPGLKREYNTETAAAAAAANAKAAATAAGGSSSSPTSSSWLQSALGRRARRALPRRSGAQKPGGRKPLLPKGLSERSSAGATDPERWLPARDRAAARQARMRKTGAGSRKEMNKGAQGMTLEGGGIGGTGSARIAGREHLVAAAQAAAQAQAAAAQTAAEPETPDVAAIAKAKSSGGKKKKGKGGKGKW
ncbi:Signal recognition particle core component [Actinomortierella ambigua]|nr:Signal recognition particle core component [Actinomortierella ambigua]